MYNFLLDTEVVKFLSGFAFFVIQNLKFTPTDIYIWTFFFSATKSVGSCNFLNLTHIKDEKCFDLKKGHFQPVISEIMHRYL